LFAQITATRHKLQAVRALRHRNFRWFWFSANAVALARGMQFLTLGWLVLELTDSATQLGLVVFLYGIPNLTLVLFGGIFADRIDRRKLLVSSQAMVTITVFALAVLTITGLVALWHIYAATFVLGVLQALNMPSRMAIVADLVGREDIMNAVVLNSAVMNSGRILGPALAGGIIELTGIGPALYINAGCYLVGTACLWLINGLSQGTVARKTAIMGDLLEGLRYFWSTPVAFTVIAIGFAFGLLGMPYVQIMPAFAREVLGVGAGGAGLLITAAGVGSLIGTLVLVSLGNFPYKNWLLIGSLFIFGLGLFLFAWSPWFWLSWVLLLFVGMGSMVPMGTTVLQLTVPAELQGRVLSLWYVSAGLMFIGALPMAVVAEALSWPISIAGGAALFLLVALWLGVWRPALRHLKV
jgi:MFS family permease